MSDREKIEKAVGLIRAAGIKDERTNPNEVYESMREYSLFELAEDFSQFINLIYDIREVLEEDDLEIKESDILEVTLPSIEEAKKVPKEMRKAECPWWLRSPGLSGLGAACVYCGHVSDDGDYVGLGFGVRPALKLKSSHLKSGDSFSFKRYEWYMITDDTALCKSIVGKCAFSVDGNSNEYESSDIKKWLNDWWKKIATKKGEEHAHVRPGGEYLANDPGSTKSI